MISVSSFSLTSCGDAGDQLGAVHVERNLGDDDLFLAALGRLGVELGADLDAAAAGLDVALDAFHADERAAGGEIGALDVFFINSAMVMSGLSICAQMPSMTSVRLCGARLVAMPTAMPVPPLTRRLGNAAGSTTGSMFFSS